MKRIIAIVEEWFRRMARIGRSAPALAVLLLGPGAAWAALGGDVTSVQRDMQILGAARHSTGSASFTVHELTLGSGTQVREYVSSTGQVFAVAWHGPFQPDLSQVLGDLFPAYVAALQASHPRHGPVNLRSGSISIQLGGRLRRFFGRVVLQEQLPAGLSLEQIQ